MNITAFVLLSVGLICLGIATFAIHKHPEATPESYVPLVIISIAAFLVSVVAFANDIF